MRQGIDLELVVLKPENAVQLTEAEQQAIPCHFLLAQEVEKRMLVRIHARLRTGHQGPDYCRAPAGLCATTKSSATRSLTTLYRPSRRIWRVSHQ